MCKAEQNLLFCLYILLVFQLFWQRKTLEHPSFVNRDRERVGDFKWLLAKQSPTNIQPIKYQDDWVFFFFFFMSMYHKTRKLSPIYLSEGNWGLWRKMETNRSPDHQATTIPQKRKSPSAEPGIPPPLKEIRNWQFWGKVLCSYYQKLLFLIIISDPHYLHE